jgi:hypothetical protein
MLDIKMEASCLSCRYRVCEYERFLFPFRIYEIEKKIHTPEKFRFPAFETTNWYAARSIVNDLRQMNNMGLKCPITLLHGVKTLIMTLKQWNQDKDVSITNVYFILMHIFWITR